MGLTFYPELTIVEVEKLMDYERWYPEKTSPLRGDIDNYVKTVMDALNGKAYADDRQVQKLRAAKCA